MTICPDCGTPAEVVQYARHGEDRELGWRTYADLSCGHRVVVVPTGE